MRKSDEKLAVLSEGSSSRNRPPNRVQKKLPLIGADDYAKLASGKFICIDKTLFIHKLVSGNEETTLITFPRRWNKTTNMTMLETFLSNHPDNKKNAELFADKKIAQVDNGMFLKEHQGQYPVILITMKDLTVDDKSSFINSLINKIKEIYQKHYYLINSEKIDDEDKEEIKKYRSGKIDKEGLAISLKLLSGYLERHWGKKVFILIDEYDAPVNEAFNNYMQASDYQEKQNSLRTAESITKFLRKFFGSALKSNSSLGKGLMTGILRVSKNRMLSDLNNLVVYGSLEDKYAEFFGFTEEEVKSVFNEAGFGDDVIENVRFWYNGYMVANVVRYNPWSVMRCLSSLIEKSPFPYQCFWVQTGSIDNLIKKLMFDSDGPTREKITALISANQNDTIPRVTITESLVYEDLVRDEPVAKMNALFTILLHAGYFTATNVVKDGVDYICDLLIPNQEVRKNYESIFSNWMKTKIGHLYSDISKHLLEGNIPQFAHAFRQALLKVFSFRDLNNESDYQLILGTILAGIVQTHIAESNRESGDGYPDFVIIPKQGFGTQGIVIELKRPSTREKEKAKDFAARKELLEEKAVGEGLRQLKKDIEMTLFSIISMLRR